MIDATSIDPMGAETEPHAISATADPDDICPTCGRTIAQHHSSVGAAPRNPKALLCPACNLKAHQNIDVQTARLECLWRQFAQASGQIKVTQSANGTQRVKLPRADVQTVLAFGAWLAAREANVPGQVDQQDTQTTSTAQRAAARAASAPPQPVSVVTAAPHECVVECDHNADAEHPAQSSDDGEDVGSPEWNRAHALNDPSIPMGKCLECDQTVYGSEYSLFDEFYCSTHCARAGQAKPIAPVVTEAERIAAAETERTGLDVDDMVKSKVSLDSLAW